MRRWRLAVCEETGASGASFLRAFVLGWEIFVRLGLAAPGAFGRRGFQFTAAGGPFAGALTAGLVLGLDSEQMTDALGIAGSQASGVMEFVHEGATVKALHAGWPAHAGLLAARLAEAGMTGPASIFEGADGFYRAYTDDAGATARLRNHLETLGERWHLREVALKLHASCHYIQPFLECLEILLERGLDPADVAAIQCEVPPGEERLICEPWTEKLRPVLRLPGEVQPSLCAGSAPGRSRCDLGDIRGAATRTRSALQRRVSPGRRWRTATSPTATARA